MLYPGLKTLGSFGTLDNDLVNKIITGGGINANIAEKNAQTILSQEGQARNANASMIVAFNHINNQAQQASQSILLSNPSQALPGGISNLKQAAQNQLTAVNMQNLINNTIGTSEIMRANIMGAISTADEFIGSVSKK